MQRNLVVVENEASWQSALAVLHSAQVVAFDTETTGLNPRKDFIVGVSFSTKYYEGFYVPLRVWDPELQTLDSTPYLSRVQYLLRLLASKKLVMHNASFDCRMVYGNFKVDLTGSLHCDTMLLKHTCDEEFPFGLKQIAKKIQHKIGFSDSDADEELKELSQHMKVLKALENGDEYPMYKVPLAVLGKYAAADADLTYRIYSYYSKELERQNLSKFFYDDEVMPLYREVTIPMEWHGIPIDEAKISKGLEELKLDIKSIEFDILQELKPMLNEFHDWFYNKDYPARASSEFSKAVAKALGETLPLNKKTGAPTTDKKLVDKMPESRLKDYLQGRVRLTAEEVRAAQMVLHGDAPTFNLSSKHHLKKLFFDKMNLEPVSKTDKGSPQVDNEFLNKYADQYPFIQKLVLFNKLVKLKGTYYERILEDSDDGMFYPSFGQHRTISGRYGSDIQQLPRPLAEGNPLLLKYNNQIREFFISGSGRKFIDTDYESLEPHVFAHVSGDPNLINIFNSGADFYSTVALQAERIEGASANKKDENYLGKLMPGVRQRAKAYALGIPYGMQAGKLMHVLNVSYNEASAIVDNYLAGFPVLATWMKVSDAKAVRDDQITTQSGRVRRFRARRLWAKFNGKVPDADYIRSAARSDAEEDALFKERWVLKNVLNNAKNFQIQALSASIVNRSAVALARQLRGLSASKGFIEGVADTYICANIHDQLIVRADESLVDKIVPIVQQCMEETYKLSVKLKAVPAVGTNFRDAH